MDDLIISKARRVIDTQSRMLEALYRIQDNVRADPPPDYVSNEGGVRTYHEKTVTIAFNCLKFGLPFFWTKATTDLVLAASKKLPDDCIFKREDLLCERGFMLFDKPFAEYDVTDHPGNKGETNKMRKQVCRGIGFDLHQQNENILGYVRFMDQYFDDSAEDLELIPATPGHLTLGSNLKRIGDDYFRNIKNAKVIEDYDYFRFFVAALLFLNQKILTVKNHPPSRQQRKIALRENEVLRDVNIVTLRRNSPEYHASKQAGFVEWSCQWAVRGHWRNQFFPSEDKHKTIWIDPHIKGPEDKPLRVSSTVFNVSR